MNKSVILLTLLIFCFFTFSCKKNSDSGGVANTKRVIAGEFVSNFGYESICKTTENNIAIVAKKSYTGHLYVAMMNPSLDVLWERTFDSQINNAGGITGTDDGGVVIASNQFVPDSTRDGKYCLDILKLNSKGDLQWEKRYSFLNFDPGPTYPIRETSDKGFIIGVLNTIPDTIPEFYPTLFKINAQGDSLWSKTVHNLFNCIVTDIGIAPDGGFLVSGPCSIYKTDSLGNTEWFNKETYHATTLQVFPDGSFIALKRSELTFNYPQLYKADANGNMIWEQTYQVDQIMDICNVCPSKENGYVFTYCDLCHTAWMMKTDEHGNKLSEFPLKDVGTWGIVQVQNKYYCFNYDNNVSTHFYNLVVKIME